MVKKHWVLWGAAVGLAGAATYNDVIPSMEQVGSIVTPIAGAVDGTVDAIHDVMESGTSLAEPVIGSLAPAAFPIIAGAKWANILVNKYGPDNMYLKALATITWGVIGWAATTTVIWPYLAVAGLGYTAWKSPKVLEWIARKGIAAPTQGVKWIGDGWKRGKNAATAKNWSNWPDGVFA